jgi:outer membrane biosynthesis protein TonB
MVRVAAGFRLVLALALALLGFAFTHVFVSASRAAEVTTTIPKPDPPPTTSAQRNVPPPAPPPPQPQTQPVVPQPPPSPAPSPRPASPPPAVPAPPDATVDGATQRPVGVRRVRKQTARHLSERVRASAHIRPPRSNAEREAVRAAGPLVPNATPRASSNLMALLLAIAIGLPLIAVGTALMPAWALPQFVLSVVDKRRGDIVFAGIVVLLSGGVGLLIARVLN